ncbi:hypothetical protein HDU80_004108, partial [Chytriomyces hyalinus]
MSYQSFQDKIKTDAESLFGRAKYAEPDAPIELRPRIFGTHSFRKTYYLIGVWAGASDIDIAFGARHVHLETSMIYKQDAATLLQMHKMTDRSTPIKMDYKPTRVLQPALAKKMVHHRFSSVSIVAELFCIKTCKIDVEDPISTSVDKLMQLGENSSQGLDLLARLKKAVQESNIAEAVGLVTEMEQTFLRLSAGSSITSQATHLDNETITVDDQGRIIVGEDMD